LIEPRHAHQHRLAVDLRRARAAFAGFAVPSAGEVVGGLGLNLMNRVKDDHAFGDFGGVVFELAAVDCRARCETVAV
jgi:hypothetical protein